MAEKGPQIPIDGDKTGADVMERAGAELQSGEGADASANFTDLIKIITSQVIGEVNPYLSSASQVGAVQAFDNTIDATLGDSFILLTPALVAINDTASPINGKEVSNIGLPVLIGNYVWIMKIK